MSEHLIEGFRLSPQQRRLWRLQSPGGAVSFVAQSAVIIEGPLKPETLRAALEQVVERHEILRTIFHHLPEIELPLQVIAGGRLCWRQEPRTMEGSLNEHRAELEAILNEARQPAFDLKNGPVLRALLFELADGSHLFIITLPSLLADPATLEKLLTEIWDAYAAGRGGEQPNAQTIQYADLSEWQNELLETEDANPGKEYWRRQHLLSARPLKLPYVNHSFDREPSEPSRLATRIPATLTAELKEMARASGCSLQALLLACWQILLCRLTGEPLMVTSTRFDGRNYAETENALGLCARYLPVRTHLAKSLSFAHVAKALFESLEESSEWQEYFIEESDQLPPGKKSDGLRIGFEYVQWPLPRQVAGLTVSFYELYSHFDRHDLKLSCVEKEDTLLLEFFYDAASFEKSVVDRLAGNLQALLKSALARPNISISRLEILSDAERQQLLSEFNDTAREIEHELCIHEVFEQQVKRSPDATALLFQKERLSYRELNERAGELAERLQALGVGPETLVGICVERSIEMIVGILAILKAGGAYLPLDPSYPKERLAFMLEDTHVPVLLTERPLLEQLPAYAAHTICLDQESAPLMNASSIALAKPSPDNPAYVIYTSGSTGRPKGVVISHRNLCHSTAARLSFYDASPARFLLTSSFAFDSSVAGIFWTLCSGGTLVLPEEGVQRDVPRLAELIAEHHISHLLTLPSVYALLLEHTRSQPLELPSTVIVAGEACHGELIRQHLEISARTDLFNEYGPTESTVWSAAYDCRSHDTKSPVPIGRPIMNTQVFLLDAELELVPVGFPGEVYIGGCGLARGYHNNPELTAERFIPDPFAGRAGARLYRTGDLARYTTDGNLEFLGRNDEQVKVRGFRIELREIESVLEQHNEVQQAVVLAREDQPGAQRLVAYVKPSSPRTPANDDLRQFLKAKLPDYMIPSNFVMVDMFPLTPNGKVDRKALKPPENFTRDTHHEYNAPRDRTEEVLSAIWSEILGVEQVGINDNFFELGGDSIRGIQAIARANRAGIQLTPQQLFQHQTIARLAAVAGSALVVRAEQGVLLGTVPLTPIQRWFFELDLPEPHHFNQSVLLEIRQALDFSLLEQAVSLLLIHHDGLRLRFERGGESDWRQAYGSTDGCAPVTQVTLQSRTEEEYRTAIQSADAQLQSTLDLSRGPVVRFTLFRSAQCLTDRLHIAIHHLAVDGVSWRILLEDLQLVYQQLARGEAPRLPPKTTSYQYWAERLSNYAQSEALRQEAAYWISQIGTFDTALPLDFKEEPHSNTVAAAQIVSRSLDEHETKALLSDVPRLQRVKIDDLLLTALARSIVWWTHHKSLLVCVESHGRQDIFADVDLSRTVGWFTTHFPLRLTLSDDADVGAELKTVKEQLRRVPNHGMGYGLLRYLSRDEQIKGQLEHLPPPRILFNYFGNLDQILPATSLFSMCRESMEHDRSLKTVRDFLLEVNAYVMDGRLTSEWAYSSKLHRRETIESLADAFIESLRVLIDYCRTAETAGLTPSDFPKATLNQTELDHLLSKLMASREGSA